MISLLIPTRGRPEQLDRLLASVLKTTQNLENIEILLLRDRDDTRYRLGETMVLKREGTPRALGASLGTVWGDGPFTNLSEAYNRLGSEARGEILWVLNDDCEILTPAWDTRAAGLKNYGRTTPALPYSEFPMIHRDCVRKLGWVLPPFFPAWGADNWTYKVYLGAGAVTDLRDIVVRHHRREFGPDGGRPAEYRRMEKMSGQYDVHQPWDEWAKKLSG